MRRQGLFGLALSACFVALFASPALAARIRLRNGFDIKECWIITESKAEVVVAVIRDANVGKIVLAPEDIESIDHTTETTLEVALAQARAKEEARKAAERAAAQANTPTAEAPSEGGGKKKKEVAKAKEPADQPPPATPEEEELIKKCVQDLGDVRRQGSSALRRENATNKLRELGPKCLPWVSDALADPESPYRRMGAALVIADLAAADRRLGLYVETVPRLLSLFEDPNPYVRAASNKALESISETSVGYVEPQGPDVTDDERAAVAKWKKWWDDSKALLPAAGG